MRILLLDNYDSFTYNLLHYAEKVSNAIVEVRRNNEIHLQEVEIYDKILISPGPGVPSEAGILKELIQYYAPHKSILGICLGHQAIAEVFGCSLLNMTKVYHGVAKDIHIKNRNYLYQGVPNVFKVGRYHSWCVNPEKISEEMAVDALDDEGNIMGISHKKFDVKGVQFHPESILSEYGEQLMKNWIIHKK